MKTTTKILLTLAGITIAIILPAILLACFYIQTPGIVLSFLMIWVIYLLVYIWRLPVYKELKIKKDINNQQDVFHLKTELLMIVSPKEFISENPGKAAKAVEIQARLESTDADDLLELKKIRIEIEQSLGVAIDYAKFSKHLFEVFSPSKYKGEPEYVNEMIRICSDIAECGSNIGAIEDTIINAMKRIAHWNSLVPSYKKKMIQIFMWAVIGSATLWLLNAMITPHIG